MWSRPLSRLLGAPDIPCLMDASLHSLTPSSWGLPHVALCLFSSCYKDASFWIQGPPSSSRTSSELITSAKTLFPKEVISTGAWGLGLTHSFWGTQFSPQHFGFLECGFSPRLALDTLSILTPVTRRW